jgi:hypothetical protein
MKNATPRGRKSDSGNFKLSVKSINPGNAFVSRDAPQCKEHYSEIGANATGWERPTVVDLIQSMIG